MACLLLGMPNVVWGQTTFTLDTESIKDSEGVTPDDEENEFDDSDFAFVIKDKFGNKFHFENDGDLYFIGFELSTEKKDEITELIFPTEDDVRGSIENLEGMDYVVDFEGFEGWYNWYKNEGDGENGITIDFTGCNNLEKIEIPEGYDNAFYVSNLTVGSVTCFPYFFSGKNNKTISIGNLTLKGVEKYYDDLDISDIKITESLTLDNVPNTPIITLPEMANAEFKSLDSRVSLDFSVSDPKSIYINGGKIVLTGDDFLKTTNPETVDGICVQNLESFIVEGNTEFDYYWDYDTKTGFTIPYDGYRKYGRRFDKLKTIKINSTYTGRIYLPAFMFDGCYMLETLELNSPGMTDIPAYCFAQSTATTIVLPPYVEEIGQGAFMKEFVSNDMSDADKIALDGGVLNKVDNGYWKDQAVATHAGVQVLKYQTVDDEGNLQVDDEGNPIYATGFPPSLKIIQENGFYTHQMYDCHIPNTLEKIGAWGLAGLNQDTKYRFVFTFDEQKNIEDYKRPTILGENALYNAYDEKYYEIRVPQVAAKYFLYYDATVTEKTTDKDGNIISGTGYLDSDGNMFTGYNIRYAVADNAVKPYTSFTTKTATAVDADGYSAYKQTFWLPYACRPEKVERKVAETSTSQGVYDVPGGKHYYDMIKCDFDINATLKAYYVGGKFVETKAGVKYDKVMLSPVKDDIIGANTPVMITSDATSVRNGGIITDEYLVTFNLFSSALTSSGITTNLSATEATGDENWLKAYTTLDGNDFMQSAQALKNSFAGVTDNDHINFVLNDGVFKMLQASGDSPLSPGKAIMSMPSNKYTRTSASGAKGIQMVFANDEDVITGISEHSSSINDNPSSDWYNLQGQRVDRPQHGIFIRNGKKVVVK